MKTNILDRYLYAIGKTLPPAQKEDILKELASTLTEMAEEQQDSRSSEDVMIDVIRTFGDPSEVGSRYTGRQPSLIGPALYPLYWTVLKIVWLVAGIVFIVLFGIEMIFGAMNRNLVAVLVNLFTSVYQTGMISFAFVTAMFAIVERIQANKGGTQPTETAWDPKSLPEIPIDKTPIKPVGEVVTICFNLFFLYLLHSRYQHLGFYFNLSDAGKWSVQPLFQPESLAPWVWPMTGILLLTLVLSIGKLVKGSWTGVMHLMTAISDFAIAVVFLLFLNTPAILNQQFEAPLVTALTISLRITAVAVAIPLTIDGLKHLFLTFKHKL